MVSSPNILLFLLKLDVARVFLIDMCVLNMFLITRFCLFPDGEALLKEGSIVPLLLQKTQLVSPSREETSIS